MTPDRVTHTLSFSMPDDFTLEEDPVEGVLKTKSMENEYNEKVLI